mmetsp:Transcript_13574/g.46903  ORF Transcript_13574/g.46903 Transcript_13574/m.46903 type:complete len:154 (-) Transcript_13574:192-653(-)
MAPPVIPVQIAPPGVYGTAWGVPGAPAGHCAPVHVPIPPPPGHTCSHRCGVEHLFGNVFRCAASGNMHVCDTTCDQRVVYDNHTAICRLSRRLFPLQQPPAAANRVKRGLDDGPQCHRLAAPQPKRLHCGAPRAAGEEVPSPTGFFEPGPLSY